MKTRLDFDPLERALADLQENVRAYRRAAEPVTFDEAEPRQHGAVGSTEEGLETNRVEDGASGDTREAPGANSSEGVK